MKKFWLVIPLVTLPFIANSEPYVTLGYGFNTISHDEVLIFSDSVKLEPKTDDGVWSVNLGYRINDFFAFEAGFQGFKANDSREKIVAPLVSPTNPIRTQHHWDSEIKATRASLTSFYVHDLNDAVQLKAGLGLTLTKYDFNSSTHVETENVLTGNDIDHGPIVNTTSPANKTETKVGAVASLGIDYTLWQNVTIGMDANFAADSLASTVQLLGTVGYTF